MRRFEPQKHGRFAQGYTRIEILALYGSACLLDEAISGDRKAARARMVDTVRLERGRRIVEPMRWGLIPGWWQLGIEPTNPVAFNAPADIVAKAPLFQSSVSRRHCLIPASGFYELARGRAPYYFTRRDGSLMTIAGLWDEWRHPDTKELIRSCAAVVGAPCRSIAELNGFMPIMLEPGQFELWLSGEPGLKLMKSIGQTEPGRYLTWKSVEMV